MKNLLTIATLLFALTLNAQNDVTKFLGIPVDGSKAEMIQKLKTKGFTSTSYDREILEGEFNGRDVTIYVQTNNNKVWRIIVSDASGISEQQIKIHFNNLCSQFENNSNYISTSDFTIPESEDIAYEMLVHKKQYQAVFFQRAKLDLTDDYASALSLSKVEDKASKKVVWFTIMEQLSKYIIVFYYENEYNRANGEDL